MSGVLADSSAWIDFIRAVPAARKKLDPLLAGTTLAVCGPVFAEVVSGARERASFDRLSLLLRLVNWIELPPAAWEKAAEARFSLARQGFQANLLDLVIALTAVHAGYTLLTRDRDFKHIARVLPVDVEIF